ncbi:MAG: hypothetical protein ACXVKK_03255 [Flavisolibacter sp.]
MTNDEKILKVLETMQTDISDLKQIQTRLEVGQERQEKNLETLHADASALKAGQTRLEKGQKEQGEVITRLEKGQLELERGQIQLERGQEAIKGMVQLMNTNLVPKIRNHDKRLDALEEATGTPRVDIH